MTSIFHGADELAACGYTELRPASRTRLVHASRLGVGTHVRWWNNNDAPNLGRDCLLSVCIGARSTALIVAPVLARTKR